MDNKALPSYLQPSDKKAPAGSTFKGQLKWGDQKPINFVADIITSNTDAGYLRVMGVSVDNVPPPLGERIIINVHTAKSGNYKLGPEGSSPDVYVTGILVHGDSSGGTKNQNGKISIKLNSDGSFTASNFQFKFTVNGQDGEFLNGTVNIPSSK